MPYGFNEDKSKCDFNNRIVLWENPKQPYTRDNFNAQTITIPNFDEYDEYEIIYASTLNAAINLIKVFTTGTIPIGYGTRLEFNDYPYSQGVIRKREVKYSETGLEIGDCNTYFIRDSGTGTSNSWVVPLQIIGYKH